MHTHMHTHKHTYTNTCTHVSTHTHAHTHTHTHTHSLVYTVNHIRSIQVVGMTSHHTCIHVVVGGVSMAQGGNMLVSSPDHTLYTSSERGSGVIR